MDKWEFHSSPHIAFIDSDALEAGSESPGEETETEVSVTALEEIGVALTEGERCATVFLPFYINARKRVHKYLRRRGTRNMLGL